MSAENSWLHEGQGKGKIFIFQLQVTLFQRAELGRLITQNTFHTNPFFYIKPKSFLSSFSFSVLSEKFSLSLCFFSRAQLFCVLLGTHNGTISTPI